MLPYSQTHAPYVSLRVLKQQAQLLRNMLCSPSLLDQGPDLESIVTSLNGLIPSYPTKVSSEMSCSISSTKTSHDLFVLGQIHSEDGGTSMWVNQHILGQSMLVYGEAFHGRPQFILQMSNKAHEAGMGVLFVSSLGDTSVYAKLGGYLAERNQDHRLRVINLLGEQTHRIDLVRGMDKEALVGFCTAILTPFLEGASVQKEELSEWLNLQIPSLWERSISSKVPLTIHTLADGLLEVGAKNPTKHTTKAAWEKLHSFAEQAFQVLLQVPAFASNPNLDISQSLENGEYVMVLLPHDTPSLEVKVMTAALGQSLFIALNQRRHRPSMCFFDATPSSFPASIIRNIYDTPTPLLAKVFGAKNYPNLKDHFIEELSLSSVKVFLGPQEEPSLPHKSKKTPSSINRLVVQVIEKSMLTKIETKYYPSPSWASHVVPCPALSTITPTPTQPAIFPPVPPHSKQAKVLLERLKSMPEKPSLAWCQETVSRMMGFAHFHEAVSSLNKKRKAQNKPWFS